MYSTPTPGTGKRYPIDPNEGTDLLHMPEVDLCSLYKDLPVVARPDSHDENYLKVRD